MYNIVMQTPEVLVVDDLLPKDAWDKVFNQVQVDRWRPSEVDDKYWHITDGFNYKGQKRHHSERPYNDNSEVWFEHFTKFLDTCPESKNFAKDYKNFAMQCHAYPVNSKNPWHHDLGFTTYTYYLHRHWQINWDGTLMIIPLAAGVKYQQELELLKNSVQYDSYKDVAPMEMFEQSSKFQSIIDHGLGIFVSPKPNRLVLINKNVIHGITRVDPDAGQNSRVTLTGFIEESESAQNR
jgi:Rps23 Pro-64 3,4-dihydroxylase Tpa1-like proline 4-hydroxylase